MATTHPLSNNSLARATVVAFIRLESISNDPAAYPVVPAAVCRVLRELGEDAIRAEPRGLSAETLSDTVGIHVNNVTRHLQLLPGLLALYAPGTIAISCERQSQKRAPNIYRLHLA